MNFLKEYELFIWAGIAVAAVIAGSWFIHYERDIGRKEILAKNAEIVAAQTIHNAEVEARAGAIADEKFKQYKATISQPVANPHSVRVCNDKAGTGAAGAHAGSEPGNHGAGGLPRTVDSGDAEAGVEIGPATETILRDATARVKVLQDYIRACQAEGLCLSEK